MSAARAPHMRSESRSESRHLHKEAAPPRNAPTGRIAAPLDLSDDSRCTSGWFDVDTTATETAIRRGKEHYYQYVAQRAPPSPPNSDGVSPLTPAPLGQPSSAGAEDGGRDPGKRAVPPLNPPDTRIIVPRPQPSGVRVMQPSFRTAEPGPPPSQPQPQPQPYINPHSHSRKDSKWKELPARPVEEAEAPESAACVAPNRKAARTDLPSPERSTGRHHTAGGGQEGVLHILQRVRKGKEATLLSPESSANNHKHSNTSVDIDRLQVRLEVPRPDSSTIGMVERIHQVQLLKHHQQAEKPCPEKQLTTTTVTKTPPTLPPPPKQPQLQQLRQPEKLERRPPRYALPKLTRAERFWLHRHYRGEAPFLKAWGLSIGSEQDRAEGLVILRELIDADAEDKARGRRDCDSSQRERHATALAREAGDDWNARPPGRSPNDALSGAIEKALQDEGAGVIAVDVNLRLDSGVSSVTEEFIRSAGLMVTNGPDG